MTDEAKSVRIGRQVLVAPKDGRITIDPPKSVPDTQASGRSRWTLSPHYVGLVERLARTRYEVSKLVPEEPTLWSELAHTAGRVQADSSIPNLDEHDIIEPIAQSVWASTEIEREGVFAEDVKLAIVGQVPTQHQKRSEDYAERIRGTRAVYGAYVWALSQPFPLAGNVILNPDFIVELHRRMFATTKSVAGQYKTNRIVITWGGFLEVLTLAPDRVREFLARACDRLNSSFFVADNTGRYSKLLAVAEFLVDYLAIHPFEDGNGRTARLLSTYLLERAGYHFARFYPLDTIILERQQEYYRALYSAQRRWFMPDEDLTPWIEFYLEAVFAQWLRAHEKITRAQIG